MPISHRPGPLSLPAGIFLAALSGALGGCAGDGNLVRDAAMAAGVTGSEPKPAPDFVAQTRPASTDYLPIGTQGPARPSRPKSAAAVTAAEAEMGELRRRNEARGAQARRDGAR